MTRLWDGTITVNWPRLPLVDTRPSECRSGLAREVARVPVDLAGYLLGSYRIATAPEPNSSRLTSFKSIRVESPANNVGPWPASVGCTTNSFSSFSPSSAYASGSVTPPTNSPLPDSRFSC